MEAGLEKEINQLITKILNQKKTQFGKVFSEVGTSDSNLILRTKGDVKIQWGGKFIDLIKDGKINSNSDFQIKKITSKSDIPSGKGIYITQEQEVLIGDKNDYVSLNDSNYISFLNAQNLDSSQIETAQKNIGLVFDDEDTLKDSGISKGIVYLNSTQQPYSWNGEILIPLIKETNESKITSFDEIQVNKIISNDILDLDSVSINSCQITSAEISELNVYKLNILNDTSVKTRDLSDWDIILTDERFIYESVLSNSINGTVINKTENTITLKDEFDAFYSYELVYVKNENEEVIQDLICTSFQKDLNNLSFIPTEDQNIINSTIIIPYIVNDKNLKLYKDEECTDEINTNYFNFTGNILNSNIQCAICNYEGNLNLNKCTIKEDIIQEGDDLTPEEILDILFNQNLKEVYYNTNSFCIKKPLPKRSLILCLNPDVPVEEVKITIQIPSVNVYSDSKIIGKTEEQTIDIPLTQILVNQTSYKWALL